MRAGIALILLVALAGCGTTRSVSVEAGYYTRSPIVVTPVVKVSPGYRRGWHRGWYK